jgi:hypothetical protein
VLDSDDVAEGTTNLYNRVPAAGSAGDVIVKQSGTNYDLGYGRRHVVWKPAPSFAYGHFANGVLTMVLNTLYHQPILLPDSVSISQITVGVNNAGSAGALVRLGIYLPGSDGLPGSLLVDAGTINGASATLQSISINETISGLVYLSAVAQVATCTTRSITTGSIPDYAAVGATTLMQNRQVFSETGVTGALPATAASPQTPTATGIAMRVTIA